MITVRKIPSSQTTTATDVKARRRANTRLQHGRARAVGCTATEGAGKVIARVTRTTTPNGDGSFGEEDDQPRLVYQVTAGEQHVVERAMAEVRRQIGPPLGGGMRSRSACLDSMATEFLSGLPFDVPPLKWQRRARGKIRFFWLRPHPDQFEMIENAIDHAKSLIGAESDGEALEFIAWTCLRIWRMQDQHNVVGGPASGPG